jgi:DNA-binding LytR/AlgR family response regulator
MIKTLIIEDEEPAAKRLEKLLAEIEPEITILEKLDSVESAVEWFMTNNPPDLVMLDIQLADGLCFEIFKNTTIDSFVIFTTAYDEYAIRAFELNSLDYLLKPIDKDKLARSIEKFKRLRGYAPKVDFQELINTLEGEKKKYKKRFIVNIGSKIKSVETTEVAYFYSLEKSTFICTQDNHHYPVDFSLDNLEGLIDPDNFFRINRQYIINFACISKIHVLSKSRIKIETLPAADDTLLVSTAKTHSFRLWLDR